jgi:ATP/maltotriose-dependent transcriptional regulator MalT
MRSSYYYLTSQLEEASESAANAMEYVPPAFQRLRVHAMVVMCLCLHATGKHKEKKVFLERQFNEPGNQIPQIQVLLLTMNCCLNWLDGEVSEMRQEYLRLHRVAGVSGVYQHQIWAETFPATGAYWCNDLDEVERLLGFEIKDPFLIHLITLQDLAVVLVFTHLARGRIIEAQTVAGSLTDFALDIGNPGLNRIGEGLQAEIALAAGTFDQANQWASVFSEKQPEVQFTCYIPEFTLAKVLISQNTDASRERCADVLAGIEKYARSTHFRSFLIMALGLKAILLDQGSHREGALEVLSEALCLASEGGGTRFFLDLGQPLARLLESMNNLAENDPFTLRLLHEFAAEETHVSGDSGQIENASKSDESSAPGQPILTRRELDVLQLLSRRLRDKQIATQLFISAETVKTHLKNIFQKLDVHSREQAVVRARELNIQYD